MIHKQFRESLRFFEEIYGRGFQADLSRESLVKASYINDILKGRKSCPEEVRRALTQGIKKIYKLEHLHYEAMLRLGMWIINGNDGNLFLEINPHGESLYGTESTNETKEKLPMIILQRIKKFTKTKTTSEISAALETTPKKIAEFQETKKLPLEWLDTLQNKFNIPKISLFIPLQKVMSYIEQSYDILETPADKKSSFPDTFYNSELVRIPLYKSKLSEDDNSFIEDEDEAGFTFKKAFIISKGTPGSMALFKVTGDSMNPVVYNNDIVLVDMSINDPYDIIDGKIYTFQEDHSLKVKKLSWQGSKLLATSENIHAYPPYFIEMKSFQLIGKVVWLSHEID